MSSLFGADGYPPSAFYFTVVLGVSPSDTDSSFQEVSGITSELNTESVTEGGENRYVHTLPTGMKPRSLALKRGIAPFSSPLVQWCRSVFELDFAVPIVAMPVRVYLMDATGSPVRAWLFANAYPIKWEVERFGSTKNEVAIENITLSYTYSNRLI